MEAVSSVLNYSVVDMVCIDNIVVIVVESISRSIVEEELAFAFAQAKEARGHILHEIEHAVRSVHQLQLASAGGEDYKRSIFCQGNVEAEA